MAIFGGISAPLDFANASFIVCDQMIAFKPDPTVWDPVPQSNGDPHSSFCSGQSGDKHSTGLQGASASLEFNGTAIIVSGTIEDAQYNIVSVLLILG
jgi:hypothetical protein